MSKARGFFLVPPAFAALESAIVWRQVVVRCVLGVVALASFACGSQNPSAPGSTPPPSGTTARAKIEVVSVTVIAESLSPGFVYRTIVQLRETGGVAAKIASVDLRFSSGGITLASLHDEQPMSEGSNIVLANSTIATRELLTSDNDPSHTAATTVRATVTYTDPTSTTATSEGSGDVGTPIAAPPAQIHTLTGVIGDDGTHRGISGARVQVISGANVGMEATADGSSRHVLEQLAAGPFRLRAFASAYDPGEQNVTVPATTQADFLLRPSAGCFFTLSPGSLQISAAGGTGSFTATPSAGTCRWSASASDSWIAITGPSSGTGATTLSYRIAPNEIAWPNSGNIAVEWPSGRTTFSIYQTPSRAGCQPAITLSVPATWRGGYVSIDQGCSIGQTAIDVPWIRVRGTSGGGRYLDVLADANTGAARTGHINLSESDGRVYTRITITQDAAR